ncbi:MAG: DNA mismatch repair endonuclease MutL [Chloroflexi bacterium]|nr:DNA mismatch repair endonuclease MutL [Chloroflexota bacterium]
MTIRLLAPDVSAKIAAGEVIERPASVAKELLENAIDAGASEISLEIAQGGRALIRIIDNGCGIAPDEAVTAFARHATSKLCSADDLYRIQTLGFRGEALASIASVSQLTMLTRTASEPLGTLLRYEGGELVRHEPSGCAVGTSITVENLFYNMPARLRFLRSDTTEAGHIARLIMSYALAFPDKRLTLINNGRQTLATLGTGQLYDALTSVYGLETAEQTMPIEAEVGADVHLSGYIGYPSLQRANRADLIFFVNRRWVTDSALSFAVIEAYRTLLPNGRYPLAVLMIDLPPDDVDVNIHPTKREVRFRRGRELFGIVQRTVRANLMSLHSLPAVETIEAPVPTFGSPRRSQSVWSTPAETVSQPEDAPRVPQPQWQELADAAGRLPMLRVLGQLAQTFIIAEGPGGLYLIDQHAAAERIRYEELRERHTTQLLTQELLDPLPLTFSASQIALLEGHLEELAEFGIELEPFGADSMLVRRIPVHMLHQELQPALLEMLDEAERQGSSFSWQEQALITLSCHTAVRAGSLLSLDEMRALVRQLELTDLPHSCPHGRPTMVHLSQAQLEREFARR